jgi:hypothetical protein
MGCGRGLNSVVVGTGLVSWRLKIWRRVQGWKKGRLGEVPVRILPVQTSQKERYFHENEHDEKHKYDEILNQDNDNQDGMSYSLKTNKEKTENLIYDYDMDTKKGNKDTQKYGGSYNQECDETDTQIEMYFGEQE